MNDLKISTRISLGYLVITLAFLVLSGITAWLMESVSQSASRMEAETELLHLADLWQANVRQNFLVFGSAGPRHDNQPHSYRVLQPGNHRGVDHGKADRHPVPSQHEVGPVHRR